MRKNPLSSAGSSCSEMLSTAAPLDKGRRQLCGMHSAGWGQGRTAQGKAWGWGTGGAGVGGTVPYICWGVCYVFSAACPPFSSPCPVPARGKGCCCLCTTIQKLYKKYKQSGWGSSSERNSSPVAAVPGIVPWGSWEMVPRMVMARKPPRR